jgi:hypothetical protein
MPVYRIKTVVNVETDIISSIRARLIGREQSVIQVIMYVKTVFLSFFVYFNNHKFNQFAINVCTGIQHGIGAFKWK